MVYLKISVTLNWSTGRLRCINIFLMVFVVFCRAGGTVS